MTDETWIERARYIFAVAILLELVFGVTLDLAWFWIAVMHCMAGWVCVWRHFHVNRTR
jgi:hypothetical protein